MTAVPQGESGTFTIRDHTRLYEGIHFVYDSLRPPDRTLHCTFAFVDDALGRTVRLLFPQAVVLPNDDCNPSTHIINTLIAKQPGRSSLFRTSSTHSLASGVDHVLLFTSFQLRFERYPIDIVAFQALFLLSRRADGACLLLVG